MRGSYYDVLGVSPTSSADEIRTRYLRLMRRYHPDRNPSPLAHARAAEINQAYRFLSDADLRAGHNAALAARRQSTGAALAIGYAKDRSQAMVRRRRRNRSPLQRFGGRLALAALLVGTGVVGWQLQARLRGAGPVATVQAREDPGDEAQAALAAYKAADLREAHEQPPLQKTVVQDAITAFRKVAAQSPARYRAASEACHQRAFAEGGWDSLDFCVTFDEAAYLNMRRVAGADAQAGYIVQRHDEAAHLYIAKLSNLDAIQLRLEGIAAEVRAAQSPKRTGIARVLHGISKRSRRIADQAMDVLTPDQPQASAAHDF